MFSKVSKGVLPTHTRSPASGTFSVQCMRYTTELWPSKSHYESVTFQLSLFPSFCPSGQQYEAVGRTAGSYPCILGQRQNFKESPSYFLPPEMWCCVSQFGFWTDHTTTFPSLHTKQQDPSFPSLTLKTWTSLKENGEGKVTPSPRFISSPGAKKITFAQSSKDGGKIFEAIPPINNSSQSAQINVSTSLGLGYLNTLSSLCSRLVTLKNVFTPYFPSWRLLQEKQLHY